MTAPLKLKKEQEVVLKIKKERNIENATVDVVFVNDVSGSMEPMCASNGVMRTIMQKAVAAASIMDPNKKVEVIAFDNHVYDLGSFGENDFDSIPKIFDREEIKWGGTNYGRAFEYLLQKLGIINHTDLLQPATTVQAESEDGFIAKVIKWVSSLFGFKQAPQVTAQQQAPADSTPTSINPTLVLFFTDGEDFGSESVLNRAVSALLKTGNVFIMAVGCNYNKAAFNRLIALADKNYGMDFIHASDINVCNDNLYEYLLTPEFVKWIKTKQPNFA